MYNVYLLNNSYLVTFADNKLGLYSKDINTAFKHILTGSVHSVKLDTIKKSIYLFSCNSLKDAQNRHPEYFI